MLDKIFNYENPVISFLTFLGKLILLNCIWLVCCIPVFTIGAATTAMYKVMFQIVRKCDTFPFRTYFSTFKKEFSSATKIWLILLVMFGVFGFDLYFGLATKSVALKGFIILGIMGIVFTLLIFTLVFPMLAMYNNSIKEYMKNSFLTACSSPFRILLICLIWAVPVVLTLWSQLLFRYLGFIWFMCGFSVLFYFSACIIETVFKGVTKEKGDRAVNINHDI